jgi:hypothetical protein
LKLAPFLAKLTAFWMVRQWDWRREQFAPELHCCPNAQRGEHKNKCRFCR